MKHHLYIDGNYLASSSGETFKSINPANGETIAIVDQASEKDVEKAVLSSEKAFSVWSENMTDNSQSGVIELEGVEGRMGVAKVVPNQLVKAKLKELDTIVEVQYMTTRTTVIMSLRVGRDSAQGLDIIIKIEEVRIAIRIAEDHETKA